MSMMLMLLVAPWSILELLLRAAIDKVSIFERRQCQWYVCAGSLASSFQTWSERQSSGWGEANLSVSGPKYWRMGSWERADMIYFSKDTVAGSEYFRVGNTMKCIGLWRFPDLLEGRIRWDTGGSLPRSDCYGYLWIISPGSATDTRIAVGCSSGRASQQALRRHPLVLLKVLKANITVVVMVGYHLDQICMRYFGLAECFVCSTSLGMPNLAGWKADTIISRSLCWDLILRCVITLTF